MLTPVLKLTGTVSNVCKRDIGVFAPALQNVKDPIQQLFLDKIAEYKSKTSGGKGPELSPEMKKELETDRQRIYRQFNTKEGENLNSFPSFKFQEPKLEPPKIQ